MLAAYRMRTENSPRSVRRTEAEEIVADLLTSPEFQMLSLFLLALLMFAGEPWNGMSFPRLAVPGCHGLVPGDEDEQSDDDGTEGNTPPAVPVPGCP